MRTTQGHLNGILIARDCRCLLNSVATRFFTVTNLQDVTIFFVARETAFRDFSIANAVYTLD